MKLKYKVQVRLNGIDKEGNRIDKCIEEYFIDENPIVARKKAISKLQSYIDIFNDAKILDNQSWKRGQQLLKTI